MAASPSATRICSLARSSSRLLGTIVVFALFGLYRHWVRYASGRDYMQLLPAVMVAVLLLAGYVAVVHPKLVFTTSGFVAVTVPSGVLALWGLLFAVLLRASLASASARIYERPFKAYRTPRDARRVLIVGAGDGGRLLLREIMRNPELHLRPVGFVDDDPRKQGARIDRGLEVLGSTASSAAVLDDVGPDEVLIAVPSAPGSMRARVVRRCRNRGVPVRTMPTVFELLQTAGG